MKTTKTFEIEIQRSNVTPAQFLAYVRSRVDAKGGKYCRSDLELDYFKRGDDLNFDTEHEDGMREKSISKPYEMQTYIRYANGACYNEICEFEFDDEKTGHGYYYLVNVDAAPEDQDANTAETLEGIAKRAERAAERATKKAAQIREYLTREGQWLMECYVRTQTWEAGRLDREAAEAMQRATECRQRAALLRM